MATEYKLSYTASEIDEKLGMVDTLNENKLDVLALDSAIETALPQAKASGDTGFIRICANGINETSIITINEPIE